jgi:hypothetical protein
MSRHSSTWRVASFPEKAVLIRLLINVHFLSTLPESVWCNYFVDCASNYTVLGLHCNASGAPIFSFGSFH